MQDVISFRGMEGSVGILAAQELKAALGICCGLGNKEIARELDCSPSTIKKSVERVFFKLGIRSRSAVPTELFCRGIARKLSVLMCAAILGHAVLGEDQAMRIRRCGNGGERRVELRASAKRAEEAVALA
ncbi:helix-turn-helix transcriptional regulator [Pseudomonas sp. BYT-5]|uniref:response regulator transcription factor n=1 Tax=unclassified Pseudomonas TaxID=196821 RepID=UPI002022682E|nr:MULTISPECIES: helix-turn-helix transcriptional regulator [unclassified Pseudomonas]URD41469.1 helix-turn-helix transcriptional regulator [Pseudomonas sp. BYT-5]URK96821.1 helix-turn-helix transcriptional regulator [Pseudomonas sp. BYT-1]